MRKRAARRKSGRFVFGMACLRGLPYLRGSLATTMLGRTLHEILH